MRRTMIALTALAALPVLPGTAAALTGDPHPVSEPRYLSAVGALGRDANDAAKSCGATLVAPEWALTAAHCVSARTPIYFRPLSESKRYLTSDVIAAPSGDDLALVGVPGLTGSTIAPTAACMRGGTTVRVVSVAHGATEARLDAPAQADLDLAGCDHPSPSIRSNLVTWTHRVGVCGGDSGSPVLAQAPEGQRVIGVVTHRPHNGTSNCAALRGTVFTAGYLTRIGDNAGWLAAVSSHPPSRVAAGVTYAPGPDSDEIVTHPRWAGWTLRLTPADGSVAYEVTLGPRGEAAPATGLYRGAWSAQLWHPSYATLPDTQGIHVAGPRVTITEVARSGRTISIIAHGPPGARLRTRLRAPRMRARTVNVRPGVTRIRIPRTVRRRAAVALHTSESAGSTIIFIARATRRPLHAEPAPALPALPQTPSPVTTPEPAALTAPIGPWLMHTRGNE